MEDQAGATGRLAELRTSARGWHGVQLAVLGFIGLCGVLQRDSTGTPLWLQITTSILILVALALACIATVLVATAAWPVDHAQRPSPQAGADEAEIERTFRRLRAGIVLTFVAVVVLAVATSTAWFPSEDDEPAQLVEVATAQGSVCGELIEARSGVLALDVDGQSVSVSLGEVADLVPVSTCD